MEKLAALQYKELQALAKAHGIKANLKRDDLVEAVSRAMCADVGSAEPPRLISKQSSPKKTGGASSAARAAAAEELADRIKQRSAELEGRVASPKGRRAAAARVSKHEDEVHVTATPAVVPARAPAASVRNAPATETKKSSATAAAEAAAATNSPSAVSSMEEDSVAGASDNEQEQSYEQGVADDGTGGGGNDSEEEKGHDAEERELVEEGEETESDRQSDAVTPLDARRVNDDAGSEADDELELENEDDELSGDEDAEGQDNGEAGTARSLPVKAASTAAAAALAAEEQARRVRQLVSQTSSLLHFSEDGEKVVCDATNEEVQPTLAAVSAFLSNKHRIQGLVRRGTLTAEQARDVLRAAAAAIRPPQAAKRASCWSFRSVLTALLAVAAAAAAAFFYAPIEAPALLEARQQALAKVHDVRASAKEAVASWDVPASWERTQQRAKEAGDLAVQSVSSATRSFRSSLAAQLEKAAAAVAPLPLSAEEEQQQQQGGASELFAAQGEVPSLEPAHA